MTHRFTRGGSVLPVIVLYVQGILGLGAGYILILAEVA